MTDAVARIESVAAAVRGAGFEDVVLLGMGGSSLAPEVLRAVIGVRAGWPRLHMLDSTDPGAVLQITSTPARTLFILASKSGGTIEPNSLAAHFKRRLVDAGIADWASHFIAITDEGTALASRARKERFREAFINPTDIGGRYSALSFFGLVPAALMGQNVSAIIAWGRAMLDEAQAIDDPLQNPAVGLGLLMAAGAKAGRDKLTLVVPPELEPFGLWVEQLVAESTGKEQQGVVPIAGETFGSRAVYGDDRLFVRLRRPDEKDEERVDRAMTALGDVPSATLTFSEPEALGAEFMRWEIATAVAGAVLGINPFDEPNVQQAKDATGVLLAEFKSRGQLPRAAADEQHDGVSFGLTGAARLALATLPASSFLTLLTPGDYLSTLAYLADTSSTREVLHHFRMSVRDRAAIATMSGYGPRYLHSTGQLHKGGPNTGVFVLITADPATDLDIPGESYSFGTLEMAQALGDFASLDATGRRGLHIHLPAPTARWLSAAFDRILTPLAHRG
jgi:glucose-6-phosphate isomerase